MFNTKNLENYLDKIYQNNNYKNISILIRDSEKIIFEKNYGYISPNVKCNSDTIYGIASLSKSMTTLACAILQVEGKLNFLDPVCKYFSDFHIPNTKQEDITLKHLAMHTAGIPILPILEWSAAENSEDSQILLDKLINKPKAKISTIQDIIDYLSNSNSYTPIGEPGKYMSYSNEGYSILSYIVDIVSGSSLEEFLEERIFKPLNMNHTFLDICGEKIRDTKNIAPLYDYDKNNHIYTMKNFFSIPPYRGCACVKSTANDLALYFQMLANKGMFNGKRIVPGKAIDIIVGEEFPLLEKSFYCYGLEKRLFKNHIICEHSGGLYGISSHGGYIDNKYSVVLLSNQSDVPVMDFILPCYNMLLNIPLDTEHTWTKISNENFHDKINFEDEFVTNGGIPYYITLEKKDSNYYAIYLNEKYILYYCDNNIFSARKLENPNKEIMTLEVLINEKNIFAVRCHSMVFQKKHLY